MAFEDLHSVAVELKILVVLFEDGGKERIGVLGIQIKLYGLETHDRFSSEFCRI